MSSNYGNAYFPNNNTISREMTPVNEDMAIWSNSQFTFDESLTSPLSPEDCDLAPGRQVYHQSRQDNQMPAASGLTPFLSQISVPPSPSSPPQTSNVSNFPTIYPPPASSQKTIPVHSSGMSEEVLQRQFPNPQPIITDPTTQKSSSTHLHSPTLDVTPLQNGLLAPPIMMTGHPYYHYSHMTDPNYICRLMAEEDKRRRNTAASARFRVKKKLREQALEKTSRDMSTKAEALESKVRELEREIKWLRSLIVEKDPRLLDLKCPDVQKDGSQVQVEQN